MMTVEIDTAGYNEALKKHKEREKEELKKVLRKGTVTFATFAARYTPPGQFDLKKKKAAEKRESDKYWAQYARRAGISSRHYSGDLIPSHLYRRKYLHIPTVLKTADSGALRDWMREEYERGIRYIVRFNVYGQRSKWVGYRTWAAAKQAVPIKRRGLGKVSWGANLNSIGQRVPKNIQVLTKKAPALAGEKSKNKFAESFYDGKFTIDVINHGIEGTLSPKMGNMIRNGASKKAMQKIDREIEKLQKKQVIL